MLQNFDRLKTFYHVYAAKSVAEAAKVLHVSQSAVSQAVQKLEAEIRTPLFIRRHKQLIPTAAGDRLFGVVQPFMDGLELCLENLEYAKDQPFGELRIGSPPEFGKAYLPAMMAEFRRTYPAVTFRLVFGSPEELLPAVESGELDMALVDVFQTGSQRTDRAMVYAMEPVLTESVILFCSRNYYQENFPHGVNYQRLVQQDHIAYGSSTYAATHWLRHHYGKPGKGIRVVMSLDNVEAVIAAVKEHAGMGITATHLVHDQLEFGEFVRIETGTKDIVNRISLVLLQDKILTVTEKTFIRFFKGRLRVLDVSGLAIYEE